MKSLLYEKNKELVTIEAYIDNGGFSALRGALEDTPEKVIETVEASNLVGRGGAGFPTGLKMQFVASNPSPIKYIICNADEGEPGTFKDRELLKHNPFSIIEGMIISAYVIGASKGYLYVRGEYAQLKELINNALEASRNEGYLGNRILGNDFAFDIEYRSGTGAYVCGEETALIESIEGRSGDPRIKPPYTAEEGLWGKPTLVNNVETLANLLPIINLGPIAYKAYGTEGSAGTKLFSVSGSVNNRGVFEVPFGTTIQSLIDDQCGGVEANTRVKFVQVGGSSGVILPASELDTPLSYEAFKAMGAGLGSGSVLVVDESVCVLDFLKATAGFFHHESCGKCTPCREGNRHIVRILQRLSEGEGSENDCEVLRRTSRVMKEASFCGLGQTAPTAILSMIENFREEMLAHLDGHCHAGVCMDGGAK